MTGRLELVKRFVVSRLVFFRSLRQEPLKADTTVPVVKPHCIRGTSPAA